MNYSDIFADGTKDVTIHVKGEEVSITVKDGLQLRDMSTIAKNVRVGKDKSVTFNSMDAIVEILEKVIVAWPFLDKANKPVPVNKHTIGSLRGPVALELFSAVEKDIFSSEEEATGPFVVN